MKVGTNNELNREMWIEKTLKEIPNGKRILDAGAGELKHKVFCSHLNYVSQDFAQYDGTGDGKGLQTDSWDTSKIDIVSDIIDIPEPNGAFDVIMCTEVFEHLVNPALAIKEFARLLKPQGKMILTAPFCSLTHFAPYHFASGFNEYWYREQLDNYGFKILQLEKNGNYFEYMAQEIRRIESIAEKYSKSSLGKLDKMAVNRLLGCLEKFSSLDKGSSELLYFGCHVLAEKK